jgi:hypothetical protein
MGRPKGSKNKTVAKAKPPLKSSIEDVARPGTEAEDLVESNDVDDDGLGTKATYVPAPPPTPTPQPMGITADQLAQATITLSNAVQTLADTASIKKIPFSKFKTHSPFNPTGKKNRQLTRRVFQNYFRVDIHKLHDEEISLLNQVKTGKYINNLVTIREVLNGSNTDLHILYNNKTPDQRMTNQSEWRNFTELLKRCLNEGRSDLQPAEV